MPVGQQSLGQIAMEEFKVICDFDFPSVNRRAENYGREKAFTKMSASGKFQGFR